MASRIHHLAPLAALLAMAACGGDSALLPSRPADAQAGQAAVAAATSVAPTLTAPVPRPTARTADELNTTSPQQRAEAAAAPAGRQERLGTTVASLGDPTQPGFWIKTPLVSAAGKGRIVNPANGKSANVEMLPLPGPASGGSQVSLPALQLIGVSLTDLPRIEVYRQ